MATASSYDTFDKEHKAPKEDHVIGVEHEEDSNHEGAPFLTRAFKPMVPGSLRGSMFTLASSAIGAGVLGLPLVLKNCGLILGLSLLLVGALLALLSIEMLVECGLQLQIMSYSKLVDHLFGPRSAAGIELTLVIHTFGSCVAYLLVISQAMHSVFGSPLLAGGIDAAAAGDGFHPLIWLRDHPSTLLLGIVIAIVLPLSLMRNMSSLQYASVCSVMSMLYVSCAIFFRGFSGENPAHTEGLMLWNLDWKIFSSVTITFFAYTCHVNIFPIMGELTNPLIRRIRKVTRRSVVLELVLYGVVAVVGYMCFHALTQGNILNNFPSDDPLIVVGRVAVSLSLTVALPLAFNPCRSNLENVLFSGHGFSMTRHVLMTITLVAGAFTLAVLVPEVSVVFGLIGATCSIIICFVIPFLAYVKVFRAQLADWQTYSLYTLLGLILLIGGASVGDSLFHFSS